MTRIFRLLAFLSLGLLLGGSASYAFAGYAQLKAPSNVGGSVGARTTSGAASVSGGAMTGGFSVSVAGHVVTVPAVMRFASNAGQVALTTVRGGPAIMIGTAVAGWLMQQGIEYYQGQFMKSGTDPKDKVTAWSNGFSNRTNNGLPVQGSLGAVLALAVQVIANDNCGGSFSNPYYCPQASAYTCTMASSMQAVCNNPNSTYVNLPFSTTVEPTSPKVPATEADFAPLATAPLPDAVAEELAAKGAPLPLQNPEFDPTPQTVPLSDPYPKPGGQPGETVRDLVRVTPAPGETVKIETAKEPVTGPDGEPIPEEEQNPEAVPPEQKDFCIEHPEAMACWESGEPEDSDVEKVTAGSMISPVGIGGGGSCPANKTVNYMGANLVLSFTPICTAAGWINPIVLALAWLSAGYILIGAFKQG